MSCDVTLGTNFLEMSPCARAYVRVAYEKTKQKEKQQNKNKAKQKQKQKQNVLSETKGN